MSLILDALNRSDRDARNQGVTPGISTQHHIPEQPGGSRHWLLIGMLIVLLALCLVILVTVAVKQRAAQTQSPSPPAQSNPTPQAAPPKEPIEPDSLQVVEEIELPSSLPSPITTGSNQSVDSALSEPDTPDAVAELYATQITRETITLPAAETIVPATTDPVVSDEELALAQYLWDQSKPKDIPTSMKNPVPAKGAQKDTAVSQTPPADAQPIPSNSIKSLADVPFLHRLPVNFQNRIPSLIYAVHNYDEGYAVINKQRVYVGDAAADGVTLEEIRADGVILSMADQRFKLAAQSSWVNY